jgi:hypothetical protein
VTSIIFEVLELFFAFLAFRSSFRPTLSGFRTNGKCNGQHFTDACGA